MNNLSTIIDAILSRHGPIESRDTLRDELVAMLEASPAVPSTPLEQIAQYRLQMVAISTAALGYWKIGDPIKEEYVTVALKDVAKLYEKYDKLFKAAASAPAVSVTDAQLDALALPHGFVFDEDGFRYHFTVEGLRALLALSPQAEKAKIAEAEKWDAGYAQGRDEVLEEMGHIIVALRTQNK